MTQVNISKGIVLDVDFDKIMSHPAVVADAVRFAVKQALTNTHAAIAKDAENAVAESRALAEKRLQAMYEGSWGQTERGPRADPVEREMRAMAEADIRKGLRSIGKKEKELEKGVFAKLVAKQMAAKAEAYRKAAEAKLAIQPDTEADEDVLALLDGDADESGDESETE